MSILVNPNRPLSLDDFAAMYTAGGRSPQENASQLWFNAPTEGKSYMNRQWSNLGTGTSPENYFSDPSYVAAIAASSPSVHAAPPAAPAAPTADALGRIAVSPGNTGNTQWPMYQNEDARQTAMNLGMDQRGSYTTPDRMVASVASHLATVPHDPEHLLRDPQLQSLMQVDPVKAKFVYEKLTGASYEKDKAEVDSLDRQDKLAWQTQQRKLASAPMEFAIKTAQDLISRNAEYDPSSGKLIAWEYVPADANALDQRPVRKRVEVNPEQAALYRRGYPFAMGMPAPQGHPVDPAIAASETATAQQPIEIQKKIQANLDLFKPRTAEERQKIIDKTVYENRSIGSHIADVGDKFLDMTSGNKDGSIGIETGEQNWAPYNQPPGRNALGKIWDKFTNSWVGRNF